jgi:PAS domain S-box-containing protein
VWAAYFALYCIGIAVLARLFRDVGERARLAVERARFRAIIDEATDAIRIVDPSTRRIVDANLADCRLSGYDRAEMLGRDLRDFLPSEPALRAEHEALDAEVRAHGRGHRLGLPCVDRQGGLVRLDVTRRRVTHGGRDYDIVVARDAAPREALEAAAREATQLRAATVIAATAAHEINNPLAVVIGSLDLLNRELPGEGRPRVLIDRATAAGTRITEIVTRLRQIRRYAEAPGTANVPQILDLKRSTEPPAEERTGDEPWKRSWTRSSS